MTGSIRRAQDQGAAAIFVVYGISDNWAIWQALGGGDTPGSTDGGGRAPGFYMGYQDGGAVKAPFSQRGQRLIRVLQRERDRRGQNLDLFGDLEERGAIGTRQIGDRTQHALAP